MTDGFDVEVARIVERDEEADAVLGDIRAHASYRSPFGTHLTKQVCCYTPKFSIANNILIYDEVEVLSASERFRNYAVPRVKPISTTPPKSRSGLIGPVGLYLVGDIEDIYQRFSKPEARWRRFGYDVRYIIHTNFDADDIDGIGFSFAFFQAARRTLYRPNFVIEPIFSAAPLQRGSIIMDVFMGAATLGGGVVAYPKLREGFLAAVADVSRLRRWARQALDERRVFKKQKLLRRKGSLE